MPLTTREPKNKETPYLYCVRQQILLRPLLTVTLTDTVCILSLQHTIVFLHPLNTQTEELTLQYCWRTGAACFTVLLLQCYCTCISNSLSSNNFCCRFAFLFNFFFLFLDSFPICAHTGRDRQQDSEASTTTTVTILCFCNQDAQTHACCY